MKTDICAISEDKTTLEAIFTEVEKSSAYNHLSEKQSLHLRLLAEELTGMLPELLQIGSGEFWIENKGKDFELHAVIQAKDLSLFDKENILSVSKSGKNAAYSSGWSNTWSLNSYRESAESDTDTEAWDELEKSIIANLADDVIVGLIGKRVEIIIKKQFIKNNERRGKIH